VRLCFCYVYRYGAERSYNRLRPDPLHPKSAFWKRKTKPFRTFALCHLGTLGTCGACGSAPRVALSEPGFSIGAHPGSWVSPGGVQKYNNALLCISTCISAIWTILSISSTAFQKAFHKVFLKRANSPSASKTDTVPLFPTDNWIKLAWATLRRAQSPLIWIEAVRSEQKASVHRHRIAPLSTCLCRVVAFE